MVATQRKLNIHTAPDLMLRQCISSSGLALATAASLMLVLPMLLLRTEQPLRLCQAVAQRTARTPRLLQDVFVCVTFAWNPQKIVYLKQIAIRTAAYPTSVVMCVVSDHPDRLQELVESWNMPHIRVCGTNNTLPQDEQYALLWEHRQVLEKAYHEGQHTMYMYLEDDTDVTWEALVSWAADTEVLEPLGFSRHFFRTEVRNDGGYTVFLDFWEPINITTWNRTVHLSNEQLPTKQACGVANEQDPYWHWREQPRGCAHRHFLQMPSPYEGMWTATPAELKRFMASDWWGKAGALAADVARADYQNRIPDIAGNWPWGYPERTTGMIQLTDVPDGFWSRGLVPYDPELKQLLPVGKIGHERNGYRTDGGIALDVRHFFQPDGRDLPFLLV